MPTPRSSWVITAPTWTLEPFLHLEEGRIYNPLTDEALVEGQPEYALLREWLDDATRITGEHPLADRLQEGGWLIENLEEPGRRFYLKYASLEASTVCNQGCYFCPVSVARREVHHMPMELYERIAEQLSEHRDTLDGVSMVQYNEPTADQRFLDQIRVLRKYGLAPAVLTNGTGLTPARVDTILELGGLRFLSINLSTLDRDRYSEDRDGDHLPLVLRNLDYLSDLAIAPDMEIAVLGTGDAAHQQDYEEVVARFAGSRFSIKFYEVMDRAGSVGVGQRPDQPIRRLGGCNQTGSRPLQWLHVNPWGQCILCCQDYHDQYVVGSLEEQSLEEILKDPRMALFRTWVYGLVEAPDDFICRHCIYALQR